MPSKPPILFPGQQLLLRTLGQRLREARLRRRFPMTVMMERVGVSRPTLTKVERGDPSVTMGVYLRFMAVLGLEQDLNRLAQDDTVGRKLQDANLVTPRRRAPRKSKVSSASGGAS